MTKPERNALVRDIDRQIAAIRDQESESLTWSSLLLVLRVLRVLLTDLEDR